MVGYLRFDAIGDHLKGEGSKTDQVNALLEMMTFNSVNRNDCVNNVKFITEDDIFKFEIKLGECDMAVKRITPNEIRFDVRG